MANKDLSYFIDQIDAYLDGRLDKVDSNAFSEALNANEDLRKELESHVLARALVRKEGEDKLKQTFKKQFESDGQKATEEGETKQLPVQKSSTIRRLIPLVAAACVAALFFFYLGSKDNVQSDILLASLEDPSYDLLRGEADTIHATQWRNAVQRFVKKDYNGALDILNMLDADIEFVEKHRGKISLMTGVANLKLENYENADIELNKIATDNPYYDQAEWYLAMVAYYNNNTQLAKERLNNISTSNTHYKKNEARQYLNALK